MTKNISKVLVCLLFLMNVSSLKVNAAMTKELKSNEFIEFATDSNGKFTIGTTGGNPEIETDNNKKMLYGHPSPGTSFTTIKIDDVNYEYNASNEQSITEYGVESIVNIGQVEAKQRLNIIENSSTGREDVVEIKYLLTNNDSENYHDVGVRIMLDTMLGNNDAAPFRVPGIGSVITETELKGSKIPEYWQAFDNILNPSVIAQGTLISGSNKPDKVQFVGWPRIRGTLWDYVVKPNENNGDSAVAIYWNAKPLAPGETREFTTYYGISEVEQDLRPPLAFSLTGINNINLTEEGYSPNPFTVTAYVTNISAVTVNNVVANINLPEGLNVVGETEQFIGSMNPNEQRQVSWQIEVDEFNEDTVVNYSVTLDADNTESKVIERELSIPKYNVLADKLRLEPSEISIRPGGNYQLTAIKTTTEGNEINVTEGVSGTVYRSNKPMLVTVDNDGLISVNGDAGLGQKAIITASNNGKFSSCEVIVGTGDDKVKNLNITPSSPKIGQGSTQQLEVTATMEDGSTRDVTEEAEYASNNMSRAVVNDSGIIEALVDGELGTVDIKVTYGNISKTIRATVVKNLQSIKITPESVTVGQGKTEQIQVIATMLDGSEEDVTNDCVFKSGDERKATVDESGLIIGVESGTLGKVNISAEYKGITKSVVATVIENVEDKVESLSVTPSAPKIGQGSIQQLKVIATMGDGTTRDVTSESEYVSSNISKAIVDESGLIEALADGELGTVDIKVTYGNISKTIRATVVKNLQSIKITPESVTVGQGKTEQIQVIATMLDGSEEDVTNDCVFKSGDERKATVDESGLIIGVESGTLGKVNISAEYKGITKSVVATVVENAENKVKSLSVTSTSLKIGQGSTQQLEVIATMGDGTTRDVTSESEYVSSNTSKAIVDESGLIEALADGELGTVDIKVTYGNISKTIRATVVKNLQSIKITPESVTVGQGKTEQIQVIATMLDGSEEDVTNDCVFKSGDERKATVDESGLIIGVESGTLGKVNISAEYKGITKSVVATVVENAENKVKSLSVTSTSLKIGQGNTQQLEAIATMADGSTRNVTSEAEYRSSNTSRATVDENGLLTAVEDGSLGYADIKATYRGVSKSIRINIVKNS